jgi:PAX-interacting protein 1
VQSACVECTHLVANNVLRTVKFLTALGVVRHIVTSDWVEQSSLANQFLDENRFELRDEKMETTFNFGLRESLQRAHDKKLFQDIMFYMTPGVEPTKTVLSNIARSCAGRIVDSLPPLNDIKKCINLKGEPTFVVVSCTDDLYLCQEMISRNIAVHNAEFILTGVMRQQIDYQSHRLA